LVPPRYQNMNERPSNRAAVLCVALSVVRRSVGIAGMRAVRRRPCYPRGRGSLRDGDKLPFELGERAQHHVDQPIR